MKTKGPVPAITGRQEPLDPTLVIELQIKCPFILIIYCAIDNVLQLASKVKGRGRHELGHKDDGQFFTWVH